MGHSNERRETGIEGELEVSVVDAVFQSPKLRNIWERETKPAKMVCLIEQTIVSDT